MQKLQQKICYQFHNKMLLKQALTHKSAHRQNNERMEFLGDSVLAMVLSEQLYQQFPNLDEGSLTQLRAQLVNGRTLCEIAKELALGDFLILSKGLLNSGATQCSILENALEALFAAVFLDADYTKSQAVILGIYRTRLQRIQPTIVKDAKTQLQEYLQRHQYPLPHYELQKTSGKDHCAVFSVMCVLVEPKMRTLQQGKSIKVAEQACAQAILHKIAHFSTSQHSK